MALATEIDAFILENLPGPKFTKILFISFKLILFFFKKLEIRVVNRSKFSLLFI